jgi:hypothetical protein
MKRLFAVGILLSLPVLAQQNGTLKAQVNPGRAGVFLDGKYLGPAANFRIARSYSVPAGEHELKLVEPRYQEITKKVSVQAGKTTVVKEKMQALPLPQPPFGRVRTINADKFAPVYVNDKFYGHVDEFSNGSQGLLLPPGTYEIKIAPSSGPAVVQKVTVEANKIAIVQ